MTKNAGDLSIESLWDELKLGDLLAESAKHNQTVVVVLPPKGGKQNNMTGQITQLNVVTQVYGGSSGSFPFQSTKAKSRTFQRLADPVRGRFSKFNSLQGQDDDDDISIGSGSTRNSKASKSNFQPWGRSRDRNLIPNVIPRRKVGPVDDGTPYGDPTLSRVRKRLAEASELENSFGRQGQMRGRKPQAQPVQQRRKAPMPRASPTKRDPRNPFINPSKGRQKQPSGNAAGFGWQGRVPKAAAAPRQSFFLERAQRGMQNDEPDYDYSSRAQRPVRVKPTIYTGGVAGGGSGAQPKPSKIPESEAERRARALLSPSPSKPTLFSKPSPTNAAREGDYSNPTSPSKNMSNQLIDKVTVLEAKQLERSLRGIDLDISQRSSGDMSEETAALTLLVKKQTKRIQRLQDVNNIPHHRVNDDYEVEEADQ